MSLSVLEIRRYPVKAMGGESLASAALEVALDRGQIDDWFGSAFICWMLAIGVIG